VRAVLDGPQPPQIDAKDGTYGNTALIHAAAGGHREIVALLLDKGANIETSNHSRRTALVAAAIRDRRDVVLLLLERGADVNVCDLQSKTAEDWTTSEEIKGLLRVRQPRGGSGDGGRGGGGGGHAVIVISGW
jgi:ankyrin repeat protein